MKDRIPIIYRYRIPIHLIQIYERIAYYQVKIFFINNFNAAPYTLGYIIYNFMSG